EARQNGGTDTATTRTGCKTSWCQLPWVATAAETVLPISRDDQPHPPRLLLQAVGESRGLQEARRPISPRRVCEPGVRILLLGPERADEPQLAFDRARHTAEFGGDLLVAVPFHLPHRDLAQLGIAKLGEQLLVLLGHLCGKLGGRFAADDLAQADFLA